MREVLLIGAGAFLGANARFLVSGWIARHVDPALPWGTLAVNVSGSLLIGAFLAWTGERVVTDPGLRLLVAVGFCGSYTTFSSFAFESMRLLEQGHWWGAAGSMVLNNALALGAVVAGVALVRWASAP